jgi:hypothetical protein
VVLVPAPTGGALLVTADPALAPTPDVAAAVVAVGRQMIAGYLRLTAAGNLPSALKEVFAGEVPLGTIRFAGGSATPVAPADAQAIAKKFKAAVGGPAQRVDIVTVTNDPGAGDQATREGRAAVVAKAVGGTTQAGQLFAVAPAVYASTSVSPERTIILVVPAVPQ